MKKTNELPVCLTFEGHEVRWLNRDGAAWAVAKDVCDALEIGNARMAVTRLEDDEKMTVGLTDAIVTNYRVPIICSVTKRPVWPICRGAAKHHPLQTRG